MLVSYTNHDERKEMVIAMSIKDVGKPQESMTIGGFTRSVMDGGWYDKSGQQASEAQTATLDRMAAEREARQVAARCSAHPAYEAHYCPLCGTAREVGR